MKQKALVNEIKAALSFCDDEPFIPLTVDVENAESGKREKIDLKRGVFISYKEDNLSSDDLAHFALALARWQGNDCQKETRPMNLHLIV